MSKPAKGENPAKAKKIKQLLGRGTMPPPNKVHSTPKGKKGYNRKRDKSVDDSRFPNFQIKFL